MVSRTYRDISYKDHRTMWSLKSFNDMNYDFQRNYNNLTASWIGGGATLIDSILDRGMLQRYEYDNETLAARVIGSIRKRTLLSATSNQTHGWFTAGGVAAGGVNQGTSYVDRVMFANDIGQASVRGNLGTNAGGMSATGNTTNGWYFGGYLLKTDPYYNRIYRMTYASDTTVTPAVSLMLVASVGAVAFGTEVEGWNTGGRVSAVQASTHIERLVYANDVSGTTQRGNIIGHRQHPAVVSNATQSWIAGGGDNDQVIVTSIQRMVYATDTATTTMRGNLYFPRVFHAGSSGPASGYFSGGRVAENLLLPLQSIERYGYSTDLMTCEQTAALTTPMMEHAAT